MPEWPVNAPLTPQECVNTVFRKTQRLLDIGLHESCALKLVAHEYGIDYKRLLHLWLGQDPIQEGDTFVQVNPAPGYPPDEATVVGVAKDGWITVKRKYGSGGLHPTRSLQNPKLWRRKAEQESDGE